MKVKKKIITMSLLLLIILMSSCKNINGSMKNNDVVTTTFTQPELSASVTTDISDVTDNAIGSTALTKITEVPELITDFNNWHILPAIDYTLYDIDNDNKDEVLYNWFENRF